MSRIVSTSAGAKLDKGFPDKFGNQWTGFKENIGRFELLPSEEFVPPAHENWELWEDDAENSGTFNPEISIWFCWRQNPKRRWTGAIAEHYNCQLAFG